MMMMTGTAIPGIVMIPRIAVPTGIPGIQDPPTGTATGDGTERIKRYAHQM